MSFCTVATASPQSSASPDAPSTYVAPVTPPTEVTPPGLTQIPPHSDDTCGVYTPPPPDPIEDPNTYEYIATADRIVTAQNVAIAFNVITGDNTTSATPDNVKITAQDGTIASMPITTGKIISDTSDVIIPEQGTIIKSDIVEGLYTFTPTTGFIGDVNVWTYTATDENQAGLANATGTVSIKVVDPSVATNMKGLTWMGVWTPGVEYHDGYDALYPNRDVVKMADDGALFVCIQAHTSDYGNEPMHNGTDTPTPWPEYWEMMVEDTNTGTTTTTESGGFLSNLADGVFDWVKNATIGDWLGAIAIGAGLAVAGSMIIDAFTKTGGSSSDNDTRYNGSPTFSGTYTPPSLRQVVASLCYEAGIENYDVSLLSSVLPCHFSLSQVTSVRTLLDNLAKAFQFDMVDSSGVLKFVPRNSTSVRTLTHDELGFNATNDVIAPVTMKRLQSIDLPRKVSLTYIAEDLDYNNFTQYSEIPTFEAGQDVNLTVPFMLSHEDAKLATDQILIASHLERMQYTFKTSYYNALDLEPGDVITIPEGLIRIVQIEEVDEGVLEISAVDAGITGEPQPIYQGATLVGYTASSYVGTNQSAQIPDPVLNAAPVITEAGCFFIDPPVMNSEDNLPRVYAAVHGYGVQGWPGAQIFMSRDGGGTYTLLAEANSSCTWGLVEAVIPASQYNYWDDVTQITVKVKTGTLLSKSDEAVLGGDNLCMIGKEAIAFGVATLTAPGTYVLSHLLRGRRGTEWAVSQHETNELFVMLNSSLVQLQFPESDRGKIFLFKVVTLGSDLTKVDAQSIQIMGENLIPWTIADLRVDRINSEWQIWWKERPRFANELKDYSELMHDPDFGGYAVIIYNDTTIIRQTIVYDNSFTYTLAMQTSDFGGIQTSVKVGINQVSNKFGGSRQTVNT